MARRRGDNIPPVSDYAHWNEDAEAMWYQENKYDMEHADEIVDDLEEDERFVEEDEIVEEDDVSPAEDDAYEGGYG